LDNCSIAFHSWVVAAISGSSSTHNVTPRQIVSGVVCSLHSGNSSLSRIISCGRSFAYLQQSEGCPRFFATLEWSIRRVVLNSSMLLTDKIANLLAVLTTSFPGIAWRQFRSG